MSALVGSTRNSALMSASACEEPADATEPAGQVTVPEARAAPPTSVGYVAVLQPWMWRVGLPAFSRLVVLQGRLLFELGIYNTV